MQQQDRLELRIVFMREATQENELGKLEQFVGNYAKSVEHFGKAQGLMRAIDLLNTFNRQPANHNGESDA